jgi:hypothetical protein
MLRSLRLFFGLFVRALAPRRKLLLENLVLRQQIAILKVRNPRPKLRAWDKLFWVLLSRIWSGWKQALVIVQPDTVVRWHRAGFKQYRGSNFNDEVISTIRSFGIEPERTSFRSPWQNGIAERFVCSCRRDLLDHVIVLNERHLKRFMAEYIRYYHDDRTHLGLEKQTPAGRRWAVNNGGDSTAIGLPRLGGLHHRYDLAA